MLIPGTQRSILLPQAPPFARRRGLRCAVANLTAQIRGARDVSQPFGPDGLQPAVAAWHRQADQVAAQIDDALRSRLDELDRRAAELSGIANQCVAGLAELGTTLERTTSAQAGADSVAASDNRRLVRATSARIETQRSALAVAARELRTLEETRNHLREAARDVADSWSRRCDELSAFHRRGFHFRAARAKVTIAPAPPALTAHRCPYDWGRADTADSATE